MGHEPGQIRRLETRIRDFINHARLQHLLLQDTPNWHVLCSALDVIGDTQLAVEAYKNLEERADDGFRYLILYGILQALVVQQDAARHVLESLKIPYPEADPDIMYVREIRHDATGHPSKRGGGRKKNPQTSNFIARFSVQTTGFLMFTESADGKDRQTQVQIPDLLIRQEAGVVRLLESAASKLREREEEHRMKFKDEKLAVLFHQQIRYYIEKIYEGCHGSRDLVFAGMHVDLLMGIVADFRAALTKRGVLPAYDFLRHEIEDTEYPLRELKKYCDSDPSSTLNERSSAIFTFFVKHKIDGLSRTASEIDEDYERETPPISEG